MGIEIPEGTPFVRIRRWIINKTCLYVDLIVGKGKATFANAILDPKPYNDLLKYTSYSYVTGKPGLDPKEFNKLKREARRAQVAIKERARMQSYSENMMNSREMESLTGGSRGKLSNLGKQLQRNDQGILKDASYDELAILAGKYGIDPTSKQNKNIGMLKAKIYNAMLNEHKQMTKIYGERDKLRAKGKTTRELDDIISVHEEFSYRNILKKPEEIEEKPEQIPIVHFRRNGSLVERVVLSAIPVYLVGQGGAGITGDAQKFFQKGLTRDDIAGKDAPDGEAEKDILSLITGGNKPFKDVKSTLKGAKKITTTKNNLSDE